MSPSYKFICYPYDCPYGSSPNILIEHTIESKDLTRDAMIEAIQSFLVAAGYSFDEGEVLDVVNENDKYKH